MIQPKPFLDKFKLRHKAFGVERRRNMTKIIMEKAPNFPLSVGYKDIDESFKEWVENDLDVAFDGKKLPTFRLFSNQRINEYAQNWQHLDEAGNLLMNFKTITRDNNPKHGKNQGESYNIPGNRSYPMFSVPTLQENGQQAYDIYSMKQPFCIDLVYTVCVVTNKYELINTMNELVHNKFKSINCYISPNGHYMPMTLEDISDESEYSLDDRKYYSQAYSIKIKAYIIKEEDFQVTRIPSRVIVRMLGVNDKKRTNNNNNTSIEIEEEDYYNDPCHIREEEDPFYYKKYEINIHYGSCEKEVMFTSDVDMVIKSFEVDNVYDFVFFLNDEPQDLEKEIKMYVDDEVKVLISKDDVKEKSLVRLIGFDMHEILDSRKDVESALDEDVSEEIIDVNK